MYRVNRTTHHDGDDSTNGHDYDGRGYDDGCGDDDDDDDDVDDDDDDDDNVDDDD